MTPHDSEPLVSGAVAEISREEILRRLRDPSLALVNVLPEKAFLDAHIPGSLSLPVAEINLRAAEVLPDKRREAAIYCGGGH